jgi:hypothetical protein
MTVRMVSIALTALLMTVMALAEGLKLEIKDAYADGEGAINVVMA